MEKCSLAFIAWAVLGSPAVAGTQAPEKLVAPPEVDLPFGDAVFPDGPGVQAISDNCVACHSADHVLNQPSLSKENWEEVVHKMVRAYKAPISPEDQERIVGYLASTKGLK
jgi:Quinohemoprotein amine dehydrogenase A, alpha subunit, haem binding